MNDNVISKADLWAGRIHAFQESGLSRKDWCQQNAIPQSTLGYWIRKIQPEVPETECIAAPVVCKAAYGTGAAVQFPCGELPHNNPSSGKYPD